MPETPSELYKKKIYQYDRMKRRRKQSWSHLPKNLAGNPRAYEGYYGVVETIMRRDLFTCQVCGKKGDAWGWNQVEKRAHERMIFLKGLLNEPKKHQPQLLTRVSEELKLYEYREQNPIQGLVVHHKNSDKSDQNPENLVTVCKSCHRRLHHRDRTLTIEELRANLSKKSA